MKKSFRQIADYRQARLSAEHTNLPVHNAPLTVCLVFPNTYRVGMSNLAVHALYALINERADFCCERSFCEEPLTGFSLETGASLAEFDIVAFSVSFELDYPNIVRILTAANIPPRSAERAENHPLIIAGGPCIFSNPEPIADFFDIFAVGEGEELMQDILDVFSKNRRSKNKISLMRLLARIPGVYVPSFCRPVYDSEGFLARTDCKEGLTVPVTARFVEDLDRYQCASVILTPYTEFSNMFLIELGRGCRRGCKFCSACYTYLRRNRSAESLIRRIEGVLNLTDRVGLVTSDFSDYPQREELLDFLLKKKVGFSVSSIRADSITEDILAGMSQSKQKTLTMAPEVASEKLMSLTGKRIPADVLLGVIGRALDHGILNFKLYFMIGFPQEEDDDVRAIAQLVAQVQALMQRSAGKTARIGRLTISVNPLIPKPFTPMQCEPFADESVLSRRVHILKEGLAKLGNTSLIVESPRMAKLQCAFARGDRRAGLLVESVAAGRSIAQSMRDYKSLIERYVSPQPLENNMQPWRVVQPPAAQKRKWNKEGSN